MKVALALAAKGRGSTSPNPMVGAVVVKNDIIIGTGYHEIFGGEHAEIIALKNAGDKTRGATLYVTMEPCCHYGKTPPCTDEIIRSGITRVVAATTDVNPLVCGGGFQHIRLHTIETTVGVLEKEARKLNESYFKFMVSKLPFVTLKLAVTLDGKIADSHGKSAWITGSETRRRVHLMRSWADAVMVGVGTVLADDPLLTTHEVPGKDPVRVIVDSWLRTPFDARVFNDTHVIIAANARSDSEKAEALRRRGNEVWMFESAVGRVPLTDLMNRLAERSITDVLCEGGAVLAGSLLNERLIDKVIMFIAPKLLGDGYNAVSDLNRGGIDNNLRLRDVTFEQVDDDIMVTGYPEY